MERLARAAEGAGGGRCSISCRPSPTQPRSPSARSKYLEQPSNYPLTSTSPPTDEQVNTLVSNLPSNLPSQACCAAVQKVRRPQFGSLATPAGRAQQQGLKPASALLQFDSAGCGCEASLSQSLSAVGLESTPTGLAGGKRRLQKRVRAACNQSTAIPLPAVSKIAATACKFPPYQC